MGPRGLTMYLLSKATHAGRSPPIDCETFSGTIMKREQNGVRSERGRLTARETQCLELLARGLRYGAIAERLSIAPVTVEKHLSSARQRLGATTREHAVALAVREGIISPV